MTVKKRGWPVMVFNILLGLLAMGVFGLYLAAEKGWIGSKSNDQYAAVNVIDYLNASPIYPGDPGSYTERYLAEYPLSSLGSDRESVKRFAKKNRGEIYVPVAEDELKMSGKRGAEAVREYLIAMTPGGDNGMREMPLDRIEASFGEFLREGDASAMNGVIEDARHNEGVMRNIAVPVEAVSLHRKALGAVTALEANLLLMRGIQKDYVGGVIGAQKVDALSGVFAELGSEFQELAEKYSL